MLNLKLCERRLGNTVSGDCGEDHGISIFARVERMFGRRTEDSWEEEGKRLAGPEGGQYRGPRNGPITPPNRSY